MLDYAHHLSKCEQAHGNRKHRWRLMGYEGSHVGRVEYGRRDDQSAILRLIGDLARERFDNAISLADAITRLDIAVTWRADPPDPRLGQNSYSLAEMFHAKHPRSARPWYTGDSDGGYTCYVGARESAAFFRVYNKEAECRATDDEEGIERYRACWRFELEAKASMAGALAGLLSDAEDRPSVVQNYVHSYAQAHGIPTPFVAHGPQSLLPGFRRRSDAESRIKHLARNVKPTLDWLRDAGELDRALSALGLR
jgi:DNA relaxase NicK